MARGINKVILVGNLGNDPETKYTQGGMAVTTVSLATTSVRKDKDGNTQERTEWHRVKFFGKLGEIAGEYLRKGSQVYVEGSIRYDKFTGPGRRREVLHRHHCRRACRCSAAVRRGRQRWRVAPRVAVANRVRRARRSRRECSAPRIRAGQGQRLRCRLRRRRHSVLIPAPAVRALLVATCDRESSECRHGL